LVLCALSPWKSLNSKGIEKVKIFKNYIAFLFFFFALASTGFASQSCEAAPVTCIPPAWWLAPLASVCALVVAYIFYKKMMAAPEGSEKMIAIAGHVREGAYAYLFSQYKIVALVFLLLFIVFAVLAYFGVQNPFIPVAFLTAGFFSCLLYTSPSPRDATLSRMPSSA